MPATVAIEPPLVFIDSGAFIGLHVPDDAHHARAVACRDRVIRYSRLFTSALVISETLAHIQRDNLLDQQSLADVTGDFLRPEEWISILPVEGVLTKSLQMVNERNDRRFSLVDATNVLLMEAHHIDIIFSFDAFYDGVSVERGHNTRFIQRISD
jgi:predicted nucleic acid-binding protein